MPAVSTLEELRWAVADFKVTGLDLPHESTALTTARTSLDEAGLLLLGEVHGVAENPLLVQDLMRVLQITSQTPKPTDEEDPVDPGTCGPPRAFPTARRLRPPRRRRRPAGGAAPSANPANPSD